MTTTSGIQERAVLVRLTARAWTGRVLDKEVTGEVHKDKGAVQSAGAYHKYLLAGVDHALKDLTSEIGLLRKFHYHNTHPWDNDGVRLLPTANYMAYADGVRAHARAFEQKRDRFLASYDDAVEQARTTLGALWRESEYPTRAQLERRFEVSVEYSPVPAKGDLRVDLAPDIIARMESEIEDRVSGALADAVADAWRRLREVVAHVEERLSQPDAVFRDTLIGNVRDTVDVLSRLNVTNDANLEAARARVAQTLAVLEPQALRDSLGAREQAAAEAADILAKMGEYFPVPA